MSVPLWIHRGRLDADQLKQTYQACIGEAGTATQR
jgi:hypothetical protein